MKNLIARFVREEAGQDLIEYALLGSFVALAAYVGANYLGSQLNGWYSAVGGEVSAASSNVSGIIP
jgi:Flp pilus assembly pilin Flp